MENAHQFTEEIEEIGKIRAQTGTIPGAYAEAFGFQEDTEEGALFDDEITELVDGMAAVKLSKATKLRIRSPWANALIIKVFGRSVGYHYLHSRIMSLWKPTERMDCVDLEKDYFLICFEGKDDFDKVLKGGLWLVGGHFLTIKAWNPGFRPSIASVSLVAMWAKLPELPIEYYDKEVLREIGEAIGLVLQVDSNTAMGARGRFARICVQVDLEKLLINTVLIGDDVQPVTYEGISTMCFLCGWMDELSVHSLSSGGDDKPNSRRRRNGTSGQTT
ncbi:uncharacterized protein LOC142620377 [Castanea sativa]|uniref:uncharacterized protein LOC142620377 n=1 Tax=Castanea sativa TaxID=21020 RepID=UPI003F64D47E